MNYMPKVAEMLGVELEEEFTIEGYEESKYRFTENEFQMYVERTTRDNYWGYSTQYDSILRGNHKIIKAPKFPEDDSHYYFITNFGQVCSAVFDKDTMAHIYRFKTGNYFLTEEEITEEDKKRIVEMLNSPERLV